MRTLLATITGLALALAASDAVACGLTPPIGPSGLPTVCRDQAVRVHGSVAAGGTSTRIDYGAGGADLVQAATVASIDVQPLDALTLTASGGASLGGSLRYLGDAYDLGPGWIAGVGVSYRLLGRGVLPFVAPSFSYSIARSSISGPAQPETAFEARDWRAGLVVGKAFGTVAPFVFARYFGGGSEFALAGHGSDHYRYHAGAGAALALSDRFDALVEIAALGERRATFSVGYSF